MLLIGGLVQIKIQQFKASATDTEGTFFCTQQREMIKKKVLEQNLRCFTGTMS